MVEDFVTVAVTAKTLDVDPHTVYDAIARKEIPAVRLGRTIRVPGAWLRRMAAMTEADSQPTPSGPRAA